MYVLGFVFFFFWRVHCGCYKQLQPCITALAAAQAYLEDLADVSVVPMLLLFFLLQFYPALDITAAAEYNAAYYKNSPENVNERASFQMKPEKPQQAIM